MKMQKNTLLNCPSSHNHSLVQKGIDTSFESVNPLRLRVFSGHVIELEQQVTYSDSYGVKKSKYMKSHKIPYFLIKLKKGGFTLNYITNRHIEYDLYLNPQNHLQKENVQIRIT